MNFPILKNKMANKDCIFCKQKLKSEFYVFNAGSLRQNSKNSQVMDDKAKGFCSITTHLDKIYENISIVENAPMGQFEFYACSIYCMKKFFLKIFSELSLKSFKRKMKNETCKR